MFVGYSKETRGEFFYSPKENKTFVLTNATFLEYDYVNNHKHHSKVVPEEMVSNEVAKSPAITNKKNGNRKLLVLVGIVENLVVVGGLISNPHAMNTKFKCLCLTQTKTIH